MIKQISTYGAILLTAMVVVRAATMEDEKDVSSLYQRSADLNYVADNLVLRNQYQALESETNPFLAINVRSEVKMPERKLAPLVEVALESELALAPSEVNAIDFLEIDPASLPILLEDSELTASENLSLDRESTINSGLSTIFNREHIHPRSSRVALQE